MANRKTFEVRKLVETVNHMLKHSTCSDAERMAMCTVLERVLFDTNNYAGFCYLDLANGGPYVSDDTNESRRHYFLHPGL
jgi:hypothetical protein